jgi:HSP20 family molecular chaperone IbpA
METIKNKTTLVGVATLIVGLALGLGIGVWGVGSMKASNTTSTSVLTPPAPKIDTPARNDRDAGKQQPSNSSGSVDRTDDWDPFRQMERMHEEIDRAIRDATERFSLGAPATPFRPDAGYSSQFDLRDRKDHFELRAYLPDAEASDVNVKIDNDRTLRVSVGHRKQEVKKESAREARVTELGHYEQVVTLPEAVKSADMKVERNGHEVVITIPKASRST